MFLFKLTDLTRVRSSSYEVREIDNDGLIAESSGHFDASEYERQLKHDDRYELWTAHDFRS